MKAEQLRKSILQLAIQGKLVKQDPNDEPASVLLERIRTEKQRLIKEGKIKKDKGDSIIFKGDDNCYYEKFADGTIKNIQEEIPFELPSNWSWCRVNDYVLQVTDFVASGSFATLRENVKYYKTENYALLVKTQDFANNFSNDLTYTDKHGYEFLKNSNIFGGELILSNVGSIGKVFIVPQLNRPATLAPNAIMVRCHEPNQTDWLYFLFRSSFGLDALLSISSATAIKKFNKTDFKKILIPIPPISEQEKIVKELESYEPLLTEYDVLEKAKSKLDTEIYDKLKKSILQYAIQGKLVEQDENDEPASVLLERIRTEKKAQLGKKYVESYIYRGDDNCYYEHIGGKDVNITEEIPFDLPENWCWVRLGEIITFQGGYAYKSPEYVEKSNYQLIRLGNVKNNNLILDNKQVFLSETIAEITQDYKIRENDILITMTGTRGKRDYFFSVLITEKDLKKREIFLNQRVGCLRANKNICVTFLLTVLQSEIIKDMIFAKETGTANQGNIGSEDIKNYILIPIPPLAEQKRIVDKINEIFAKL